MNRCRGEFDVLAKDRTINDLQDGKYDDIEDGKVDRPSERGCQDSKEFVDVHDRTQPKPMESNTSDSEYIINSKQKKKKTDHEMEIRT